MAFEQFAKKGEKNVFSGLFGGNDSDAEEDGSSSILMPRRTVPPLPMMKKQLMIQEMKKTSVKAILRTQLLSRIFINLKIPLLK